MTRVASGPDSSRKVGAFACPDARATGIVLWAAAGALIAAGCGGVAWQPVNGHFSDLSHGTALAAPSGTAVETFAAAFKEPGTVVAGPIPKLEIIVGVSFPGVGDKIAGHDGTGPPPNYVRWAEAFDGGLGIDVQISRPPKRPAVSLAAGDTFFIVRVMIENYIGLYSDYAPGGGGTYANMTLFGLWAEGRTVLNPLDVGGKVRLYLQYGGGLVYYPNVTIDGVRNWQATSILAPKFGWRAGLGVEGRFGKIGFYAEAGIQLVAPPDVDDVFPDPVDDHTAQDFVTFPVRLGMMIGF